MPRKKFLIKLSGAVALACLICIGLNPAAIAESDKLTVRVMTRNMDAGTDLNYVANVTDLAAFIAAVKKTLAEVEASGIAERAALLAAEIAATKPDLIALQEVSIWSITDSAGARVYDQLELLEDALEAEDLHYRVAVIQVLADIPAGVPGDFAARFTDQNAILVRSDLPPGHLMVIGTESHLYDHHLSSLAPPPINEIPIPNGWMAVDVKIRGARLKFVNTHLLSPVPEYVDPVLFAYTSGVQLQQTNELLAGLSSTSLPVILAGDFNSNADVTLPGPDKTLSAVKISASGFTDVWPLFHVNDESFTWPLYLEDQLTGANPIPFRERIDLIFTRGPVPLSVERTGRNPVDGPWASDHVGVVAEFDLENHRPEVPKGKK